MNATSALLVIFCWFFSALSSMIFCLLLKWVCLYLLTVEIIFCQSLICSFNSESPNILTCDYGLSRIHTLCTRSMDRSFHLFFFSLTVKFRKIFAGKLDSVFTIPFIKPIGSSTKRKLITKAWVDWVTTAVTILQIFDFLLFGIEVVCERQQ
jgi:hypothetical protein